MKKLILSVMVLIIAHTAFATPFIVVQAEEISAILADWKTLSSGSSVLSAIKLVKESSTSSPNRIYEVETKGFDQTEPNCKVLAEVEFVPKDPACLPPPGGRCDGEYVIRVVSKTCEELLQ